MSKKNIEKYIPKALEVLHQEFSSGVIPSAYNGYISSFGASVLQSGLIPTLALFENTDAKTKEDKSYLTYLIFRVLTNSNDDISLLTYVLNHKNDNLKPKIIDIAIAIKLSIRTFKLDKGEQNE